jgi:hypothetical protein
MDASRGTAPGRRLANIRLACGAQRVHSEYSEASPCQVGRDLHGVICTFRPRMHLLTQASAPLAPCRPARASGARLSASDHRPSRNVSGTAQRKSRRNTLALPQLRSLQRCLQDRTQDDVLRRPNGGRQRFSSKRFQLHSLGRAGFVGSSLTFTCLGIQNENVAGSAVRDRDPLSSIISKKPTAILRHKEGERRFLSAAPCLLLRATRK